MKISVKLNRSNKETPDGFEVVVYINHLRKRRQKVICYSKEKHFSSEVENVTKKHPFYNELTPMISEYHLKARHLLVNGCVDVDYAYNYMFGKKIDELDFITCWKDVLDVYREDELRLLELNDYKGSLSSGIKYRNNLVVWNSVSRYFGSLPFDQISKVKIIGYRDRLLANGMKPVSVKLYLSNFRSAYNLVINNFDFENKRPFDNVFNGLGKKSFNSRKRNLSIEGVKSFELFSKEKYGCLGFEKKVLAVDIFLLMFYFGGCDFIDVVCLRVDQLSKGRVYIVRSKTKQSANLPVHPKALCILNRYGGDYEGFVFPWFLNFKYATFHSACVRGLNGVMSDLGLEVYPVGGRIVYKTARHTFATIAKRMYFDSDLIRELMAHVRDSMDNYYKDVYPESVIDDALYRIVDTENLPRS